MGPQTPWAKLQGSFLEDPQPQPFSIWVPEQDFFSGPSRLGTAAMI